MTPFNPLFRNPHGANHRQPSLETSSGGRPRGAPPFPDRSRKWRVLVQSQRPTRGAAGEIVLVHGLEGSGESGYMRGMAAAALREGFAAPTASHCALAAARSGLCPTLYHAGLTSDLLAVLRQFRRKAAAPSFWWGSLWEATSC